MHKLFRLFHHPAVPEQLVWTPQLVERFWDGISGSRLTELSFSRLGGRALISAVAHLLPKDGCILDFGAGDGDLTELACRRGLKVSAYEPSPKRRNVLEKRLGSQPGFLGVVDATSHISFDVVLLIEVIEHILEEQLDSTLELVSHFVRPGGLLIVTTPNNEDLELNKVYCPVSNMLFHRWQHVRSFTPTSLPLLLGKFGFEQEALHQLEYRDDLYVPYDEIWGSSSVEPPPYMLDIRANRSTYVGSGMNLTYVGRKLPLSNGQWTKRTKELQRTLHSHPGSMRHSSMRPVADRIKNIIKIATGRRYETWIRSPFIFVRNFSRRIQNKFRFLASGNQNPSKVGNTSGVKFKEIVKILFGRRYESWVRRPYLKLRPQQIAAVTGRHMQVWSLKFKNEDSWKPLRWFICPVLEAFVGMFERYYRHCYRNYGRSISGIRCNTKDHRGLLLVSGTLGSGGSERQIVLTALGLAERKAQSVKLAVVYMRSEAERFFLHKLDAAGMPVIGFMADATDGGAIDPEVSRHAVKTLPLVLRDVEIYLRNIVQERPAIVHLWLDEVNVKGGLAAVAAGVPRIILSGRNLPPNNYLLYHPYMREAYCWLLRQPGVTLINNSNAGARAYERWLNLPAGAVRVIHNGFDFDAELLERYRSQRAAYRESHNIPHAAPLLGTVMRFNEEKRPLLWAEIAARVGQALPDAHFLVVGDGPLRKELEARVAQPDLAGRLHLVGLEKQPLEAMAAMDLFLLSSRGEGLPNVLVEAQAIGVPVITTRAGGAPETMDEGRTGWVLRSGKPDEAAEQIIRLLRNRSWRQTASNAAPEFVKTKFGLERMLNETLTVYGDLNDFYAATNQDVHSERKAS